MMTLIRKKGHCGIYLTILFKPGKTRGVFDCAAKFRGVSLNNQLLSGPDLTNSIIGVLTKLCENPVALAADIECMFHQIRVPPADRDAFRFLWWPNNDLSQIPVDHRMEVHLFGDTSSQFFQFCLTKDGTRPQTRISRRNYQDMLVPS